MLQHITRKMLKFSLNECNLSKEEKTKYKCKEFLCFYDFMYNYRAVCFALYLANNFSEKIFQIATFSRNLEIHVSDTTEKNDIFFSHF